MSRRWAWRAKPSPSDVALMEEALHSELFLVHEIGPTQFLIQSDGSAVKYKVSIGDDQNCSQCMRGQAASSSSSFSTSSSSSSAGAPQLCVHIFFVMLKVLRLSPSNPLAWQNSLLDTEITTLLADRGQRQQRQQRAARRGRANQATAAAAATPAATTADPFNATTNGAASAAAAVGSKRVPPRELDAEDCCPICQEELLVTATSSAPSLILVHCAYSCGQQLHAKCMRIWAEHQLATTLHRPAGGSSEKKLSCPMCRGDWCSSNPDESLSNQQMIRELKMREHAPPPAPPPPPLAASSPASMSTALVPSSAVASTAASLSASSSAAPSRRAAVKCSSCHKLQLIAAGRFVRCVHCRVEHNLCRVCFLRSKGLSGSSTALSAATNRSLADALNAATQAPHVHCFVEAKPTIAAAPSITSAPHRNASAEDEEKSASTAAAAGAVVLPYAYGIDWFPAPQKPSSNAASSLAAQFSLLQSRELTHEDYDLLLALDQQARYGGANAAGMMNQYLAKSLPIPSLRTSTECCLCPSPLLSSQIVRVLPCYHYAHDQCLLSSILDNMALCCPLDHLPVFPGLSFCQSKLFIGKRKTNVNTLAAGAAAVAAGGALPTDQSTVALSQHQPLPALAFGLQGTRFSTVPALPTRSSFDEQALEEAEEEEGADDAERDDEKEGSSSLVVHPTAHAPSSSFAPFTSLVIGSSSAAPAAVAASNHASGKLRTGGTAAFALPSSSSSNRRHTDVSPSSLGGLQLAGSNFNGEQPASSQAQGGGAGGGGGALRKGRAVAENRHSSWSSLSAAHHSLAPDIISAASAAASAVASGDDIMTATTASSFFVRPQPQLRNAGAAGQLVRGGVVSQRRDLHPSSSPPPAAVMGDDLAAIASVFAYSSGHSNADGSTELGDSPRRRSALAAVDDALLATAAAVEPLASEADLISALSVGVAGGSSLSRSSTAAASKSARVRTGRVSAAAAAAGAAELSPFSSSPPPAIAAGLSVGHAVDPASSPIRSSSARVARRSAGGASTAGSSSAAANRIRTGASLSKAQQQLAAAVAGALDQIPLPADLILGPHSNGNGGASTSAATAKTVGRVRRGLDTLSSVPLVRDSASADSTPMIGSTTNGGALDLAPSVSGFNRSSLTAATGSRDAEEAASATMQPSAHVRAAAVGRRRATSASNMHSSPSTSPPPPHVADHSLSLRGLSSTAADADGSAAGLVAPSRSPVVGKLRRGKTSVAAGSPAAAILALAR